MSNHFQYTESFQEMFSRQKQDNNSQNQQNTSNIYESPQRHLMIKKRQYSFNNNKNKSPLQSKNEIPQQKMLILTQHQQQLKNQINPRIVNSSWNNVIKDQTKHKKNIFAKTQSDMAIENVHQPNPTTNNISRNYQELQGSKQQLKSHYQFNTNQSRKINEILQQQLSENQIQQNLSNLIQYQSTHNQQKQNYDIELKIRNDKDQQHDSIEDEYDYDGEEGDQYLESSVGKFLNKNQQINCYSPYSPVSLRTFIKNTEHAYSQKMILELSAEHLKNEEIISQATLQSKDQQLHNENLKFDINQIQAKPSLTGLQNIHILNDITNQQSLRQDINKNENISKFSEQNICDNYLPNQLKNNKEFKMESNQCSNLNFPLNNMLQQKYIDENIILKKDNSKEINFQHKSIEYTNLQNNLTNQQENKENKINFLPENQLEEKLARANISKNKQENIPQNSILYREKELKNQNISVSLNEIKEENINKQQEGERLFQKLEKANQFIKDEGNLINITPSSKQILKQQINSDMNQQQIKVEDIFNQYLKDTLGFIENNQTDLQEQISQNTSIVDEINTKVYNDLNKSFDSIDSENEQSQYKKKSAKQRQKQQKKSNMIQVFCETSTATQMKSKFFIHSEMNAQNSLQDDLLKINQQLAQIQNRQAIQNNAIFQIIKHYQKLNTEQNTDISDMFKSPFEVNATTLDSIQKKVFQCKFCLKIFSKSCSLGGHISRVHKGKSDQYKEKQKIREKREMERKRKTHFKSKGQCLNDENSNVSVEESELKTVKNNNPSEKRLTVSTYMLEEDSQEMNENQIQTKQRNAFDGNGEIYLENDQANGDENEGERSKIITKKINKEKKRQQFLLKDKNRDQSQVNKVLFSNNQFQSYDSFCQKNILSQKK